MDTTAVVTREYRPEDEEQALALRNNVFPPISREDWRQSQTSAVALLDGNVVGVIPFTVRETEVAPGVSIRGAFANSVAVDQRYRDLGIGTRMMEAARAFLPRWAEAMFVYTGRESGGPQYRFYRKTGHYDLSYPRRLYRATSADRQGAAPGVEVLAASMAPTLAGELLDVYRACYARCAGTWRRTQEYWQHALASHIFVELPYDALWLVTRRDETATLQAYALAGLREGEIVVLEAAARAEGAADTIWQTVDALAQEHDAPASTIYGQDITTPLYASLRRARFQPEARDKVMVGRALSPEAICARRWEACAERPDVTLEIWTPERALTLRQGTGEMALSLEMKEETLHQLLFARVDLETAVREQRVTVREGEWDAIRHVAAVLYPATWIYHQLDDI